jgi:mono/diheme cytochrome c family protein
MSMHKRAIAACCGLLVLACSGKARDATNNGPHHGRPASPAVISRMDLTIAADGVGLPPESGSVWEGRATFAAKCAACHGSEGTGGIADRLTGGVGSLASAKPVRTVASYWPYATTIFDYVRRAMPLTAPQSLTDVEVYGLVAYLLSVDGIVRPDATLDAASLPKIAMPNRGGFISLEKHDFDGNIGSDRKAHSAPRGASSRSQGE